MALFRVVSEVTQVTVRRVRVVEAPDAFVAVEQRRTLPCREEYAEVVDWGVEGRSLSVQPLDSQGQEEEGPDE